MKAFLLSVFLCVSLLNYSQDTINTNGFSSELDIVNKYIWRGMDLSNSTSLQPQIAYNYKNLSISGFGSSPVGFHSTYELNMYVTYLIKYFEISIVDYFLFDKTVLNQKYFDYRKNNTFHDFSVDMAFVGTEKLPLRFLFALNFYGSDKNNSNYIEAAWLFANKNIDGEVFIGGTTGKGWYGNGGGIVNSGITINYNIIVSDKFVIPFFTQMVINPQKENAYIVAGLKIKK